MSEKEIWEKVLEIAQEKLSAVSYSTFLKDTELYTIKDGEAIVLSSIPFNANWLNQQYAEIIQAILFDVVGYEVKPHFITTEELANYSNNETATSKETTNLLLKQLRIIMCLVESNSMPITHLTLL